MKMIAWMFLFLCGVGLGLVVVYFLTRKKTTTLRRVSEETPEVELMYEPTKTDSSGVIETAITTSHLIAPPNLPFWSSRWWKIIIVAISVLSVALFLVVIYTLTFKVGVEPQIPETINATATNWYILLTEIILSMSVIVMLPFIFFGLARKDVFFTLLASNEMKFVVSGEGTLEKILLNLDEYRIENGEIKSNKWTDPNGDPQTTDVKKPILARLFGIWWVGIPPFRKIHSFSIEKQKEKDVITENDKPEKWIVKGETEPTESLRFTFPRPFVLIGAELKDRLTINLLVICKFEVVKPAIPVFVFKGKFFDNAGSILKGAIIDKCSELNINEFVEKPKGEIKGLLSDLKDSDGDLNKALVSQVGIRLVGISIANYDPSDKEVVKAITQNALAKQKGDADITKAEKDAKATVITATAEKTAQNLLTEARAERIKQTVANLLATGADANIIARAAADILRTEAVAGEKSKITTWVDGGGSSVVIPTK